MNNGRGKKSRFFVCFFQSEKGKRLHNVILSWHPDNAYSVVGVETMKEALAQNTKDKSLFEGTGWIVD